MTLADSAGAAFDAGRLPFSGLFQAARVLSNHPDRTTALSLGYRLATLHDRMATPAERVLLERALVSLYGERLRKLGYDATPGRYASDARAAAAAPPAYRSRRPYWARPRGSRGAHALRGALRG